MSVDLSKYIIDESSLQTEQDKMHLQNYRTLTQFLDKAIIESLAAGKNGHRKLSEMVLECKGFLDKLIISYETQVIIAKSKNEMIGEMLAEAMQDTNQKEDVKKN